MATADGDVLIFKRVEGKQMTWKCWVYRCIVKGKVLHGVICTPPSPGNRWDLAKYTTVKVCADGIQCMCIVQSTLWVGVKNCVYSVLHLAA